MFDAMANNFANNQAAATGDTSVTSPGGMGNPSDILASSDTLEEATNFFGGFLEQTRSLLDEIDFVGNSFGWDSKIPSEAKSGVAAGSFFTNVADCVTRAEGNDVKEGMCPFKYGSAAFDAVSLIDNAMGVSNARMGVAGNGNNIWDTIFGTGATATAAPGMAPVAASTGTNFLDTLFGTPAPSTGIAPTAANNAFSWP